MKRLASPGEVLEEFVRLRRENARLWKAAENTARWIALWAHRLPASELDSWRRGDAPPKGGKR